METKLMPLRRLAEIVADATTRAATNVTGIFRNDRMTWTQQGVHAAAWNAIMHDEEVATALKMVGADGAAEYEALRAADPIPIRPENTISVPITTMMLMAGKSGNPVMVLSTLRQAWFSVPTSSQMEKERHERAFDDMLAEVRRMALLDARP